jgi:hypothetical protein
MTRILTLKVEFDIGDLQRNRKEFVRYVENQILMAEVRGPLLKAFS